ncbi:MAG: leucine-rich repeat protein [Bacteroidales bacterium]|nr:leucine-rich repeat protein [Bacteroidales bacterium]
MNKKNIIDSSGRILEQDASAYTISNEFEFIEEIASNGYNRIIKAIRYGKYFILKGLKQEFADKSTYQNLLYKEFEILIAMNHPNIIQGYGIEEVDGVGLCIVMDYADGYNLEDYLKQNPSLSDRRRVVKQLLKAMTYFHNMQVVHRDLKPSNILITRNGHNVKIIDFGLSDADNYAVFKEPAFTRYYASPEQLEGGMLDCRSDIYSFGRVLGQIFPKKYARVVRRCTKNRRDDRYPNADAVYKAMFSPKRLILPVLATVLLLTALFFAINSQVNYNSKPFEVRVSSTQVLKMRIKDSKAVVLSDQKVSGRLIIPDYVRYRLRKFPVREIANNAFYYNTQLEYVKLPETLHTIGSNAFTACFNLIDTVTLPLNLRYIGHHAFCASGVSCVKILSEQLQPVNKQDSIEYFFNCPNLTSVVINNSAKQLCERLFEDASSALECVYFPDTLEVIPAGFLAHTYSLKEVVFPKSLHTIGTGAFYASGIEKLVLPESVEQILGYAFRFAYNCNYLEIGSRVKMIGESAFANMDKLDTLVIRATTPPLTGVNLTEGTNTAAKRVILLVPAQSVELYRKDSNFSQFNIQPIL